MDLIADVLDPEPLQAVTQAARHLFDDLQGCLGGCTALGVWDICDSVWPALKHSYSLVNTPEADFRLLPLSRLGTSEGKSGSHVMIGYFVDRGQVTPSRPMVLKFRKEGSGRDKLDEESKNFQQIRPHVAYHKDAFAAPLIPYSCDGYKFLWSPFTSDEWLSPSVDNRVLPLGHNDLWSQLRMRRFDKSPPHIADKENLLKMVFTYLSPLHSRSGTAETRPDSLRSEYEWYLRGIWNPAPSPESIWWSNWEGVWGTEAVEKVTFWGAEHANPFWVLRRLRDKQITMRFGAVHGDLHPKNIVLSMGSPHLIDFGWASNNAHIAKDFVLLECNLRFMLLRPDVDMESLAQFATWVSFDEAVPALACKHCHARANLVQLLRTTARSHFPHSTDWDCEYVIPMFLVAFGLLQHLASAENQVAAILTLLFLADYITAKGLAG